jgi:hypothetical protein
MTITISEDLYVAIMQAAAPITPTQRHQFLEALAAELRGCPEVGLGAVHRAVAALQNKFTVEARSTASSFSELRARERERRRLVREL